MPDKPLFYLIAVFQIALKNLKRVRCCVHLLSDVFNKEIARCSLSEKSSSPFIVDIPQCGLNKKIRKNGRNDP
jgi:hypothetical protein